MSNTKNIYLSLDRDIQDAMKLILVQGSPNFSIRGPHCFLNNVVEGHLDVTFGNENV